MFIFSFKECVMCTGIQSIFINWLLVAFQFKWNLLVADRRVMPDVALKWVFRAIAMFNLQRNRANGQIMVSSGFAERTHCRNSHVTRASCLFLGQSPLNFAFHCCNK
jgi:hypothetical protein